MGKHVYCMSIHSLVCPPIILSVCPLFCPSLCTSLHPHVCNHIVKIAKSIAKSSKSIEIQWYNSIKTDNIHRMKKNIEKKIALKSCIVVCTKFFLHILDSAFLDLGEVFWTILTRSMDHAVPSSHPRHYLVYFCAPITQSSKNAF